MYFWIYNAFMDIFIILHIKNAVLSKQMEIPLLPAARRIRNCTRTDAPVQFLHHTSRTFPCSIVFIKPNENVLAYELIPLLIKP